MNMNNDDQLQLSGSSNDPLSMEDSLSTTNITAVDDEDDIDDDIDDDDMDDDDDDDDDDDKDGDDDDIDDNDDISNAVMEGKINTEEDFLDRFPNKLLKFINQNRHTVRIELDKLFVTQEKLFRYDSLFADENDISLSINWKSYFLKYMKEFPFRKTEYDLIGAPLCPSIKIDEEKLDSLDDTNEQKEFVNLVEKIHKNDQNDQVTNIILYGSSGCGKTSLLTNIAKIENTKTLYLAKTNFLVTEMENQSIQAMTICKFLMTLFAIPLHKKNELIDKLDGINDAFKELKTFEIKLWTNYSLPRMINIFSMGTNEIQNENKKLRMGNPTLIIFIDEFTMESVGELSFIKYLLAQFADIIQIKIILIFAGDFEQYLPYEIVTSDHYKSLRNGADYHHEFTEQKRFDENYSKFVETIRQNHDEKVVLKTLKVYLNENFNNVLNIKYPIEEVYAIISKYKNMLLNTTERDELNNMGEMVKELYKNGFFEKILPDVALSYTNEETHYNNLSLSLVCGKQIKNYFDNTYETLENVNILKEMSLVHTNVLIINNNDMPCTNLLVLPLIRFYPYIFLQDNNNKIPKGTKVHLIHWNNNYCWLYGENQNELIVVPKCTFTQNVFPDMDLYGFPLQLAYAYTIHNSKGLSIKSNSKIHINLTNISHGQLYVALSRISNFSQIGNLFL